MQCSNHECIQSTTKKLELLWTVRTALRSRRRTKITNKTWERDKFHRNNIATAIYDYRDDDSALSFAKNMSCTLPSIGSIGVDLVADFAVRKDHELNDLWEEHSSLQVATGTGE